MRGQPARPAMAAAASPLRTVHTISNKDDSIAIDIFTYPLRVPAFQGGSRARGWGSLAGTVCFNVASDNERVNAITLSVTGTATVLLPKSGSADTPAQIDHLNPEIEEAKEHRQTILQIDRTLWQADPEQPDSNLFDQGSHPFEFDIDLPAYRVTTKGKKQAAPVLLPPSCVIDAIASPVVDPRAKSGVMSAIFKSSKEALPKCWASVKYEVSVKVQRVGLLKRNLRLSAPFVYLPPPETGQDDELRERRRLANMMAQIVTIASGDGRQPIEAQAPWLRSAIDYTTSKNGVPLDLDGEHDKKGLLGSISSMFNKRPVVLGQEAWSLSVPGETSSTFALRSAIPFILRCETNKPLALRQGSPLIVVLYRRVRLRSGAKAKAVAVQQRALATAQIRFAQEAPGVHRINGILVPPVRCVPSFETPLASLSYFLGVQRSRDGRIVHEHPITLHCLPPPAPPMAPYGPYPAGYVRPEPEPALSSVPGPAEVMTATPQQMAVAFGAAQSQRSVMSTSHYSSARSQTSAERRGSATTAATTSSRSGGRHSAASMSTGATGARLAVPQAPSPSSTRHSSPAPSVRASPPAGAATTSRTAAGDSGNGGARAKAPREQSRSDRASGSAPAVPPKQRGGSATRIATTHADTAPAPPAKKAASATTIPVAVVEETGRRARYSSRGASAVASSSTPSALSSAAADRPKIPTKPRHRHTHDEKRALIDEAIPSRSAAASVAGGSHSSVSEKGESRRSSREGERAVGDYVRVSSASRSRRRVESEPPPPPTAARSGPGSSSNVAQSLATVAEDQQAGRPSSRRRRPETSERGGERNNPPLSSLRRHPDAAPAPVPVPVAIAPPASTFTEDDLLLTATYGEDMELDLPPSYFEATAEDYDQ